MIARNSQRPSLRHGVDCDVVNARYAGEYRVWLQFRDGTAGVVDLGADLTGEVFEPLRDVRRFQDFYVDEGATLAWHSGADLAPEFLYDRVAHTPGNGVVLRAARRWIDWLRGFSVTSIAWRAAIVPPAPEISRFLGIRMFMRYDDHVPPHFHAEYGGRDMVVLIESGEMRGELSPRATQHVAEWLALHRQALRTNWERARAQKPLRAIAPLE